MTNFSDLFPRPEGAPDNPEFWRMSAAVLKSDGAAEAITSMGEFDELLAHLNQLDDVENLHYMAKQRVMRVVGPDVSPRMLAVMVGLWFDGFTAGSIFQMDNPGLTRDGNHRKED